MLRLPLSVRIFVWGRPINLLEDIDGLVQRVRDDFCEDPFSGNLFVFFNDGRTRLKLLMWDRNGFWIMSKRLERGRFESMGRHPWRIEITREEFVMLLSGIDTQTFRFRPQFAREVRITERDDDARSSRTAQ